MRRAAEPARQPAARSLGCGAEPWRLQLPVIRRPPRRPVCSCLGPGGQGRPSPAVTVRPVRRARPGESRKGRNSYLALKGLKQTSQTPNYFVRQSNLQTFLLRPGIRKVLFAGGRLGGPFAAWAPAALACSAAGPASSARQCGQAVSNAAPQICWPCSLLQSPFCRIDFARINSLIARGPPCTQQFVVQFAEGPDTHTRQKLVT